MKEKSRWVCKLNNGLNIYTPKEQVAVKTGNVEKYEIGINNGLTNIQEKTILVVGATGCGKSTFLNSLTNYAFGVEHDDDFRFKICDIEAEQGVLSAESVTKKVTAFVLNENKLGYKLTLVDSPGYGDTRGLEADKNTTGLIKELFEMQGPSGIPSLDAVCLGS